MEALWEYDVLRMVFRMRALLERDVAAVLDVAGELTRLDAPLEFPPALLERLGWLVGSRCVSYCELDRRNERVVLDVQWSDGEERVLAGDAADDGYWRLHSHPLCSYREREDIWSAYTVSDFATRCEFERTEIWNELYRDAGINYWLDIGLPRRRDCTRVFIFVDASSDFGERAKLILDLLEPHLEQRAVAVDATAAAVDALAEIEEGADPEAHDVVLVSDRGVIEFALARARALLARHLGPVNGRLPQSLVYCLPRYAGAVVAQGPGTRLTVRAARVDRLYVLFLEEARTRVSSG